MRNKVYTKSSVSAQSHNSKFKIAEDEDIYDSYSQEEDDDFGDEWDDLQDSVTFDKQRVKIDKAIKKNGDRIK